MRSVQMVTPKSSLSGRRFEPIAELSLHKLAETAAATLPGVISDAILIPEMPSPLGLPDFVALIDGQEWLRARHAAGVQPVLSESECTVLAALYPGQALAPSTVARRIGWSMPALIPVLRRLEKAGAILVTTGGAYRANAALVPHGFIFALEAKMKNWQKAILQGRGYRTWANNYVVLLGGLGPAAEQRATERIALDGAGLYMSSGWVVKPRARLPASSQRLRGFEYLYAATATSVPTL